MQPFFLIKVFHVPGPIQPGCQPEPIPDFEFVTDASEGKANYLAGVAMDALTDYHGGNFDYSVTPIGFHSFAEGEHLVARAAVENSKA